jgi:CDP-glycerol glycerophosphotransferase (TagB/SpsB family)
MSLLKHIGDVVRFTQLPKNKKQITFYSEGKNYWPDLQGLVLEILNSTNLNVCFVSSGKDDPGFLIKHKNYQTFKIDEGFVRNWFFENIETDVFIMTMPDINKYQVKRSKNNVHYIYVQHSLVSLHMVYRKGAFDHYDTIFCAGPHHVQEIKVMERMFNLEPKNLVEHGYPRLDTILKDRQNKIIQKEISNSIHILVAPSWGENATIESGIGIKIVDRLISSGYKVTLRPHPQTIKFAKNKVDAIIRKYKGNNMFIYESGISGNESLYSSDIMISDWSGAALDYAFGLGKPVWFVDVPRKINNHSYKELNILPLEVIIREKIGKVIDITNIEELPYISNDFIDFNKETINDYVYNVGKSAQAGVKAIKEIFDEK